MIVNQQFNTTPVVVHAQGRHAYKPYWQPIKEKFFASPRRSLGSVPELTILTWNNGHEAMGVLEKSLDHLGVPYIVLGQGVTDWINSRDKPRLTRDALDSISTKYVMGVDSRDAIFIDHPQLVRERFEEEFDCELVFSADRMNWPNCHEFKLFEDSLPGAQAGDTRYLNSGAWIGRTNFCREFFAVAVETPPVADAPEADQGILKKLFQTFYPRVQLDYRSSMFQNIGFVFDSSLRIT
jgi:hypothetical protein